MSSISWSVMWLIALIDDRFFISFSCARGPADLSENVSSANVLWLNMPLPFSNVLWIARVIGVHINWGSKGFMIREFKVMVLGSGVNSSFIHVSMAAFVDGDLVMSV